MVVVGSDLMKALWFMPFTFAAGAEGFALFAGYLLAVLAVVYLGRSARKHRGALAALRLPSRRLLTVMPEPQPAL